MAASSASLRSGPYISSGRITRQSVICERVRRMRSPTWMSWGVTGSSESAASTSSWSKARTTNHPCSRRSCASTVPSGACTWKAVSASSRMPASSERRTLAYAVANFGQVRCARRSVAAAECSLA